MSSDSAAARKSHFDSSNLLDRGANAKTVQNKDDQSPDSGHLIKVQNSGGASGDCSVRSIQSSNAQLLHDAAAFVYLAMRGVMKH